jgi:protein-disulfide isomerase
MKKLVALLILFLSIITNLNAETTRIISGNEDAKITIIAYESLTCSHCADFHKNVYPELKSEFVDSGLVLIEFRNFPLDMAAFNASKIAHCKNDGNSEILHFLYNNQNEWAKGKDLEELNKNLLNVIELKNFNINFDECLKNKEIEDHILSDRIDGVKKFQINATPTIIINNEKFEESLTFKNLKKYLQKMI